MLALFGPLWLSGTFQVLGMVMVASSLAIVAYVWWMTSRSEREWPRLGQPPWPRSCHDCGAETRSERAVRLRSGEHVFLCALDKAWREEHGYWERIPPAIAISELGQPAPVQHDIWRPL